MLRLLILPCLLAMSLTSAERQVAITIDDLPLGGGDPGPCDLARIKSMTGRLLGPIRAQKIPVIGFVNAGRCEAGLAEILGMWREAGAELGNHTFSHPDLNRVPLERYEADVIRGEAALTNPTWFRHPFLHTGPDEKTKTALAAFLKKRGYRIAPVTLDNSDWMFAAVYARALKNDNHALAQRVLDAYVPYMESLFDFFEKRSVEVAGHEIAQVLLIHANGLNAEMLPKLIAMMRSRGYSFVSLEAALRDPAYKLRDGYAGTGFSWIHRWSKTLGMPPKGEPDEPPFIAEEYKKLTAP
ncbi:MAG: polysaccharide deacetylase family protein [Acidobacteriota bacterium]|nr:polysaccharide deacetylase family protein [Acidobacteriota bacterium]